MRPRILIAAQQWNYNSGGVEPLGDILTKLSRQPLDKLGRSGTHLYGTGPL
jgi:hypothetical protein